MCVCVGVCVKNLEIYCTSVQEEEEVGAAAAAAKLTSEIWMTMKMANLTSKRQLSVKLLLQLLLGL